MCMYEDDIKNIVEKIRSGQATDEEKLSFFHMVDFILKSFWDIINQSQRVPADN